MKKLLILSSLVFSALFIVSCGETSTSTPTPISTSSSSYDDYSLNIQVNEYVEEGRRAKTVSSDISSMKMSVEGTSTLYVSDLAFVQNGSQWTIDLPSLPIDESLTFTVTAFNEFDSEIYSANTSQSLISGENNISMNLEKSSSDSQFLFNVSSTQTLINPDSSTALRLNFDMGNSDNLSANYSIQSEFVTFTPNNGSFDINNYDNSSLDINYTAPTEAGTYSSTITFTDEDNNTFINSFDIIVSATSNDDTTTNVVLNMAPDINSIIVDFTDSSMTILSANVSDAEGDTLSYQWTVYGSYEEEIYDPIMDMYDYISGDSLSIDGTSTASSVNILRLGTADMDEYAQLTVTDSSGSSSSMYYYFKNM